MAKAADRNIVSEEEILEPRVAEVMPEYRREQMMEEASSDLTPEQKRTIAILGAPSWVPTKPGQILAGTVVHIRRAELTNDFGTTVYPVMVFETKTGSLFSLHVLRKVLLNQMTELKPKVGSHLAVHFGGTIVTADNKRYGSYIVVDEDAKSASSVEYDWE